ncbi:MAG: hypothetical protein WC802_04670 [Patescibacteria group bacterium]
MNNKSTLNAWRNPTAVQMIAETCPHDQGDLISLRQLIMLAVEIEEWSRFERLLFAVADLAVKRAGSNDWRAKSVLDMGTAWGIAKTNDGFALKLSDEISLKLMPEIMPKEYRDSPALRAILQFPNGKAGKKFKDAVTERKKLNRSVFGNVIMGGVQFSPELYVQGTDEYDMIFSREGRERLGGRATVVNQNVWNRGSSIFMIEPLPGEAPIVFYTNGNATGLLGLPEPSEGVKLVHSDTSVFASVGPFSLALQIDDRPQRFAHQRRRDLIAVFEDMTLPVVPTRHEDELAGLEMSYEDLQPNPDIREPSEDEY